MLWLYYSSLGKSSPQRDRVGPIRIEKKAFKSTPQTLRELQIKFKDLYRLFCFFFFSMEKYYWSINAPQYNRLIFLPPACFQKSVIIVSNLCKEYKTKKAGSVFKKKKKMATKNISFCVNKGKKWNYFTRPVLDAAHTQRDNPLKSLSHLSHDIKAESVCSMVKAYLWYGWCGNE